MEPSYSDTVQEIPQTDWNFVSKLLCVLQCSYSTCSVQNCDYAPLRIWLCGLGSSPAQRQNSHIFLPSSHYNPGIFLMPSDMQISISSLSLCTAQTLSSTLFSLLPSPTGITSLLTQQNYHPQQCLKDS